MKLNIQLFATNLSVGGSYTQAWQPGDTVGGLEDKYNWRIVVNYISRDVTANTSYLRLRFQEYGTWGDYSGMNSTYSRLKISLNGGTNYTELAYKKTPSYTKGDTETKIDVYYTVNHNANGTSPTIKVQASNETSNTASYAPANKTVTTEAITLTAIPRESKLNPISDFAIATSTVIPITFTKYVDTYTHKLNVKIGSTTIKSNFTITTPYNLQFSSSEVNTIKNAFSGSSTTVTFTLSTYNGTTLIGTSVQTATGIDASRVMGLSRYKSNSGYKYCINDSLNKNLGDGLQVGGSLYVNGSDALYYKKGDTYEADYLYIGGLLSNSSKGVYFTIFLPKSFKPNGTGDYAITTCTINTCEFGIRKANGGYIEQNTGPSTFARIEFRPFTSNFLSFICTKSSAYSNVTNNTPLGVGLTNLKVTFS